MKMAYEKIGKLTNITLIAKYTDTQKFRRRKFRHQKFNSQELL